MAESGNQVINKRAYLAVTKVVLLNEIRSKSG